LTGKKVSKPSWLNGVDYAGYLHAIRTIANDASNALQRLGKLGAKPDMCPTVAERIGGQKMSIGCDSERNSAAVHSAMSELGAIAIAVLDGRVTGIRFGHGSEAAAVSALLGCADRGKRSESLACASEVDERLAASVLDRLVRYADGEPVDFSDVAVAVDHLSTFQRRVVKACRAIPAGQHRTYGQLAAAAGSPGAARAVGQVMATNRVPLVVPCHRVLAAGGGLGGFSAPQGLAMKRRLLALEGAHLVG
jgi:methylated-DNA-[protein]-cysteine S-methyltransferase